MMDVSRTRSVSFSMTAAALFAGLSVPVPVAAQAPPAGAQPLSAYELYRLYHDKTWLWEAGAAHFFDEGRRFVAWTADDTGISHAAGRYQLTDRGAMCLVGRWVGLNYSTGERYSVDQRTCFNHVRDGGTVLQRSASGGAWSVLADPDTEENMLIASEGGDVAEKISQLEVTLELLGEPRPVTPYQLLRLYGDKTWPWESGGVRFFTENRTFLAYTDDDSEKAIGEGRFVLTNDGRLCLRGEWIGITQPEAERYTADSNICFRHLENARGIYRLQPESTNWELIRPDAALPLTASLIAEDTVTPRVEELRSDIAP